MNARKLAALGLSTLLCSEAQALGPEDLVTRTHVFARGTKTYSVGYGSGGAQYGLFYGCEGPGQPMKDLPGKFSFENCVMVEYHGNGGAWLNSPDGRFFYIQNAEYMGYRIFNMVDIEKLSEVPNLKVPSVPMRDAMAPFGPDPALGEAGFSNSGDTFLGIVPRVGRTELLIYDRPTDTRFALRTSLPLEEGISGVYPVSKPHALLWTGKGMVRLYDIEKRTSIWTLKLPIFADGKEQKGEKFVVVSPNLHYALFVSRLGAALVELASGALLAQLPAAGQHGPSLDCTEAWPEHTARSLPRAPGRCGQTSVDDNGVARISMGTGAAVRLTR